MYMQVCTLYTNSHDGDILYVHIQKLTFLLPRILHPGPVRRQAEKH